VGIFLVGDRVAARGIRVVAIDSLTFFAKAADGPPLGRVLRVTGTSESECSQVETSKDEISPVMLARKSFTCDALLLSRYEHDRLILLNCRPFATGIRAVQNSKSMLQHVRLCIALR